MRIREEIGRASTEANGPKLALFTGSGRGTGVPEELGELRAYLSRFAVPVYGALGSRDLFSAVDNSPADGGLSVAESNPYGARAAGQVNGGGNQYWKETMAGLPAPWGEAQAPSSILPRPPIAGTLQAGLARTHYAFDYAPNGTKALRVVVVDSSTYSYGDPRDQNPTAEEQGDWLKAILVDARTARAGAPLPSIVVMNQPTLYPDKSPGQLNWTGGPGGRGTSDAGTFATSVYDPPSYAASAVLSGGIRMAVKDSLPSRTNPVVPTFVLGTGGAPLGYEPPNPTVEEPTKLPSDGFYHAWFLLNVDPSTRPEGGLPGQAKVDVIPFPALESIAMHAKDGHEVAAGSTLRFTGLARGLSGGFGDPDQSRATYFNIGSDIPIECEGVGQGHGYCTSRDALQPSFRFYSEDPSIADFVVPDFGLGGRQPQRVAGKVARDPQGRYGLLCGFKAGTTHVNLVSGFHRSRMKVTIDGGFGLCVDKPVPSLVKGRVVRRAPAPRPPEDEIERSFRRLSVRTEPLALFPPPPAPVVAPAPPGAPGVGRKEEHEVEYESETHGDGKHQFVARQMSARQEPWQQPAPLLGGMLLMSFFGAVVVAAARERKRVEPGRQRS